MIPIEFLEVPKIIPGWISQEYAYSFPALLAYRFERGIFILRNPIYRNN